MVGIRWLLLVFLLYHLRLWRSGQDEEATVRRRRRPGVHVGDLTFKYLN